VVAHLLVWTWRPWFGPPMKFSSTDMIDAVNTTLTFMV
jgi:hypothetical protein